MPARGKQFSINHPVVVGFVLIAVVASMYLAAEVLKPLALAILLAFALTPLAKLLERRGLPRAPASVLTVLLALSVLCGIGYVVERQLSGLAADVPKYTKDVTKKLQRVMGTGESSFTKAIEAGKQVADRINPDRDTDGIQEVRIVSSAGSRLHVISLLGPYLEYLGVGAFVLILVLFMIVNRGDLTDRIIQLFGHRQLSLTTRTLGEVGDRIGRYLAMFATVNSTFGLIAGIGLGLIGVKYAVLFGFLAAALRFIPYIGPGTAILLPLTFSFATAETFVQPLEALGLFVVMEVIANSFLEPIIYGKTTGVSALGLLVAAMFWTWLWGPLGLLLSTPLTVMLAVIGKYVPALGFFGIILGEEATLDGDVKLYQRLLAVDQDGAVAVVDEALKQKPRVEVFDTILIPALSRAERDYNREDLDDRGREFAWRVIGEVLDDLEGTPDLSLQGLAAAAPTDDSPLGDRVVLGVAAQDTADALALRMLSQALAPSGCRIEPITDGKLPAEVAKAIIARDPELVILSHVPPTGLTAARTLIRRLRGTSFDLPILVGRWGAGGGDADGIGEKLKAVGAQEVAFTIAEARDRVLATLKAKPATTAPARA